MVSGLITGCGDAETEEPTENADDNIEDEENEEEVDEAVDKELTTQIEEEEGVMGGQVRAEEGRAVATLALEEDVTDEDAKLLANNYADQVQEKYPDKSVNVQATRDGENIANITRD